MKPKELKNFIDESDCITAIDYINNEILNNKFIKSDIDKRLFQWNPSSSQAIQLVKKYSKKILDLYQLEGQLYPHVALLVKYDVDSFIPLHTDIMDEKCKKDKLSLILYFNDDYSGGDIYFPKLDLEYHPEKAMALSYPAFMPEFDHGIHPITDGSKYILAFCFTENKNLSPKWYL